MAKSCPACGRRLAKDGDPCTDCPGPRAPVPGDTGPPPDLPARYRPLRMLGRGAMGRVYLCRDAHLEVEVAIKVLPEEIASDPASIREIETEARLAARLRECRSVIQLYGFELQNGVGFLVMESAPGGSLQDLLARKGPLPERVCRKIGIEILEALDQAHRRKILHRDLKPANVLFDAAGRARLADFGLARVLSDTSARITTTRIAGTPLYMAPEAIRLERVDGRSDLYSVGCMLYEMATGKPPFEGSLSEVLMNKVSPTLEVPDPCAVRKDLSPQFGAIVRRLLAIRGEDRFPDAPSCATALRAAAARGALPGTAGTGAQAGAPGARAAGRGVSARRAAAVAGALLVLGAAAFAIRQGGRGGGGAAPSVPPAPPHGPPPEAAGPPAPAPPPGDAPATPAEAVPAAGAGAAAPATVRPGGIRVLTTPPGAAVDLDGRRVGTTGAEGLLLESVDPASSHVVAANLAWHETARAEGVTVAPGAVTEVSLVLKRVSGFLRFRGGPSGAVVTIRGTGVEPVTMALSFEGTLGPLPLVSGAYEIAVEKAGFERLSRTVTVPPTETLVVDVAMRERDGTLAVDSVPPGAEVRLGDRVLGRTPLRGAPVPAGAREFLLVHPEAGDLAVAGTVRGDEELDLGTRTLPALGALVLDGLEPGVTAAVGGRSLSGRAPWKPGPVTVVLRRAGFVEQRVEVVVRPGLGDAPEPGPWVPLPGRIDARSLPEDAEVLVDRRYTRRVDGLLEVPGGAHDIVVYRPGFVPFEFVGVEVASEGTTPLPAARWDRRRLRPAVPDLPAPPRADLDGIILPEGLLLEGGRIYSEKDGAELVFVPAGRYRLGAADREADERPPRTVALSAFLAERCEVTFGQYRRFCEETKRVPPEAPPRGTDLHPVGSLGWAEARQFAAWAGRRLPTEAEWEAAARGADGRIFPWGSEDDPARRNAGGRKPPRAERVGSFPRGESPFGCLDMAGNLREWCADWYGVYAHAPVPADPAGPSVGSRKVVRGGSYLLPAEEARCSRRAALRLDEAAPDLGFRTALSLPGGTR